MTPRLVRTLGAFILLAMAGCSSPREQGPPSAPSTTATTATSVSSRPSSAPTTVPAAADGTDTAACADGTCEIQAFAATPVPLPATSGATLTVASVDGTAARLAFAPTNVDFSFGCTPSHACTNRLTMVEGTQGTIVTAGAGATATFNKVAVTVVAVAGNTALLRISPA